VCIYFGRKGYIVCSRVNVFGHVSIDGIFGLMEMQSNYNATVLISLLTKSTLYRNAPKFEATYSKLYTV